LDYGSNNLKRSRLFERLLFETKIKSINELEWIDGKIYGNVYQKDAIAIINPKNGAVEGSILPI
jgi:glutamine cyclotransferase